MKNKKILISGAGIAGLTLAYFLKENGFEPVVVEKSNSLRDGGYMIDFFSSGVHVIEQMGLLDILKKRDHGSSIIKQYTNKGKESLTLDISAFRNLQKGKLFNFLRTDLVDVLHQKVRGKVEIRYSRSIVKVEEDSEGVLVTFNNNEQERFDLLIGADGIHSNVRELVFDSDDVEQLFLGYYVAALKHNIPLEIKKEEVLAMMVPNLQVMTYTIDENNLEHNSSVFVFKKEKRLPFMNHNEQVELLKSEFETFIYPVPEILDTAANLRKIYFDEVSQIRINGSWSRGRTLLIGDAAYCVTLLSGQGASMAMTGAYLLAQKLIESKGVYKKAYHDFEEELRPLINSLQKKAIKNIGSYLPSSKISMWIRNLLAPVLFTKPLVPFVIKQLGAVNFFEGK